MSQWKRNFTHLHNLGFFWICFSFFTSLFFLSGLGPWGVVNYLIKGLKTAAVEYILYPQTKATKAEYGAMPCNACKPPICGINSQFTFKLNALLPIVKQIILEVINPWWDDSGVASTLGIWFQNLVEQLLQEPPFRFQLPPVLPIVMGCLDKSPEPLVCGGGGLLLLSRAQKIVTDDF